MRTAMLFFYLILLINIIIGITYLIRFTYKRIKNKENPKIQSNLEKKFTSFANRSKWKRWGFTTWISLSIVSLLIAGAWRINSYFMQKSFFQAMDEANTYFDTSAPNIFTDNLLVDEYGVTNSSLRADAYKNLDGYHIPWETIRFSFGTFDGSGFTNANMSNVEVDNVSYTQDGHQKVATFFLPKINYKDKNYHGLQPTSDAPKIATMSNHLAEVAVSFDQPYSYAEIQKMIPSDLLINWYWLGANDSSNLNANSSLFGLNSDFDNVKGERKNLNGKLNPDSYKNFVERLKKTGGNTSKTFNIKEDTKKQIQKYPTLDQAKFSGLILTGRTENFKALNDKKWIFSTNVGLTTEIRPDIEPIK